MDKGDTLNPFLPLLALLAIIFPFAMFRTPAPSGGTNPQATQSAKVETGKETEEKKPELPPHSAAKLVGEFLHASADEEGEPCCDPRSEYSLHFMIAIVADPIDSRLTRMSDSSIDSIQRAFEADQYELDRFDLAWSQAASAKADESKSTSTNGQAEAKEEIPRYRRQPSLLLFRQPPDPKDKSSRGKLFLVFLVGETPTNGIHKAAMASALLQLSNFYWWGPSPNRFSAEFCNLAKKVPEKKLEIRIMGPSFSGSATSLEFALRDWLAGLPKCVKRKVKLRIVSGSATSINPEEFCNLHAGGRHTFQAVVPPDKNVMPVIFQYIYDLGRKHAYKRIAMLTEAGTAYGGNQEYVPRQASDGNVTQNPESHQFPLRPKVISLPFPLHISELRAASENQRQLQQNAAPGLYDNLNSSIHLNQGEASQPKETPPSFSSLGAPSSELVLSRLLSTITHEGIHAVGILATDVRDILFLAREIHQHCPGTLVFAVVSDVLYSHPEVNTSTRGMLVFTPYPLFNPNQVWTPPHWGRRTRIQFPSQDAEGVYNATLALLGRKDRMVDYGEPFSSTSAKKGDCVKPALWVTVVGRNGPLPVRTLCWNDSKEYSVHVKPEDLEHHKEKRPEPPTLDEEGIYTTNSALGIVLLSVVLLGLSGLILYRYGKPRLLDREAGSGWVSRIFGEPVTPDYRRQARLFLLASLICLLSFYLVVIAVYILPVLSSWRIGTLPSLNPWNCYALFALGTTPTAAALLAVPPFTNWLWWIVFVSVTIFITAALESLVLAVLAIGSVYWQDRRQDGLLQREVRVVVLAGCSLAVVLALAFAVVWVVSAFANPTEAISRYVRSFQFFSGLSLLVPLFCVGLAGFLWALCSFRRLRMIDGIRPTGGEHQGKESLLCAEPGSFGGLRTLESVVRERLEGATAFPPPLYWTLVGVGLITAAYLFFCPFVPSYEGTRFYFLFGWGFLLGYAALTTEFGRLCLVWSAFRHLLQRLAVHPMQAAYGRYHKSFPGLPRIDIAMPAQVFSVLSFSVDQAERLLQMARSLVLSWDLNGTQERHLRDWILEAERAVPTAGRKLSQALRADVQCRWCAAVVRRSQSQQALGKLAQLTAELLESSWRPTKKSPPFPGGKEFEEFRELGEEFLAGRVVLLISYVLPSLRKLGTFILIGLLLMLASVMFYPFVQKNHFLAFNWIVILAFVALALVVTVQMERDAVLSALNGTNPGQVKVTRQFTFRVLTYVMVPILLLLSAQFPDTLGQVISWFGAFQGH